MPAAISISVILPVFNGQATIAAAIDSLEADAMPGVEVIAVDDGSTDDTATVLAELAASRTWLRVLSHPHAGIAAALNAGIDAAAGKYIARMDADDVSLPGRLAAQSAYLDAHPTIGLVGGHVRFGGDEESAAGYAHYVAWINTLSEPEDIAALRFVESPFAHPAVMFRREHVERHGGYAEGDFPEDYELWLRWMDAGVRMASLEREVLIWNDPPDRLSRSDERYSVEAFYRMKIRYFVRWAEQLVRQWPDVIVWGAGRVTRQRVKLLEEQGARITAFVDIDPDKIGQRIHGVPVIAPDGLPPPGECFILPFVGARHARELIMQWLREHGYRIGENFLPLA